MADVDKLKAAYDRLAKETADTAKLAVKERAELVKAKTPAEKRLDQLKAEKLKAFREWQAAIEAAESAKPGDTKSDHPAPKPKTAK